MNQFKGVFLGGEKRSYNRAASSQKCVRAGGKHNDLENVGHTARHHTFFEMLGNFSFGDYFKKDAIVFAWELLTSVYKLPADKLWVSVFEDDDEAADLWRDNTEIAKGKIVRLGAKDNFWQMGDTGPCGPCSEIIIDQGAHIGCKKPGCAVGCECDRYLELWNLVFMQYNREEGGKLTPLPRPSIDTGMGLERISAVVQGKYNNFDSDVFSTIIQAITAATDTSYGKSPEKDAAIRVLADHLRAVTFLLSEGLMPSNEGRGYVMRRIVRRASRYARHLGIDKPFLYTLIDSVIESISDVYPELARERDRSMVVLRHEEERFSKTLEKGLEIIEGTIANLKKSGQTLIPGSEVFLLYDTYGFPLDLAEEIAREHEFTIDEAGFKKEMDAQKSRGRASWDDSAADDASARIVGAARIAETGFLGYDAFECDALVQLIVKDGRTVKELKEGDDAEVVLDRTTFYAESGGQAGDAGELDSDTAVARVGDTKKTRGVFIHNVLLEKGVLKTGDKVRCRVDEDTRLKTMRNHTATHLLQGALRNILGAHVKQTGSSVTPARLRFDFTHFYPVTREEWLNIEDLINEKIMENLFVSTRVMDIDAAVQEGAIALFDEKYGDRVRVVAAGDFSKELCGGTHCRNTGEIGQFVIVSEGGIAAGVRRIEAVTGAAALELFRKRNMELKIIEETLKTDNPVQRVAALIKSHKELEKTIEKIKQKDLAKDASGILDEVRAINGVKVLATRRDGLDMKGLRDFVDQLRDRMGGGVVFAASAFQGQAYFICSVSKDLVKRFDAGKIVGEIAARHGGKGGGKADMGQGGTKSIEMLGAALDNVYGMMGSK
jgi:alanyl-tRNA synthetase